MEQKVDVGKVEFRVEFQVEFALVCSHHTSCSVIYRAIVTRSNVARVSTNLVLEIDGIST